MSPKILKSGVATQRTRFNIKYLPTIRNKNSLMLPYFCTFFYLYPDFTSGSPKKEKEKEKKVPT